MIEYKEKDVLVTVCRWQSSLVAVPLIAPTEMFRSKTDGLEKISPNWTIPLSSCVLIID